MDPKSVLLGLREKSVGLSKAQTRIPWREIINEEMIRTLNEKERRKYGDTLLHAMALGGKYKDTVSSVTLQCFGWVQTCLLDVDVR